MNTTWSMFPLLAAAAKKLSGTRSTRSCSGPRSFAVSARASLALASAA